MYLASEIARCCSWCPSRPQATVDVAADPAEHPPVAVGVTPAQIGLQGVAGEIVRKHALRPRLHERQPPQPGEQLVRVLQPEHLPQQRLGGHPGERAHLQGAAMQPAGDDLDEPPQQGSHQIRGQRIGRRVAAANDHIGQQRQPQRVAMGLLDQLIVAGGVDATGVQVLAAVLRAQIAQRHHPQQLPPSRVGAPGRTRCCPSGDHRQGGGRQARQQPSAHPVIQRRQPLIGVEQDHHSAAVGRPGDGTVPGGHLEHLPQRLEARPAATGGDRARPVEPRSRPRRPRAQHRRPASSSCRCLVARGRGATETAVRASRARSGTARPRMRGRRIGAAGETPTGRRACRPTASRSSPQHRTGVPRRRGRRASAKGGGTRMNASIGPPCTSRDSLTSTAICPAHKRIGGGGDSVSARVWAPERLALTALPRSDASTNVQTASRLARLHQRRAEAGRS